MICSIVPRVLNAVYALRTAAHQSRIGLRWGWTSAHAAPANDNPEWWPWGDWR